jgi:alpha-galactosidase
VPEATTRPADSQLSTPATLEWGARLGLEIRIGADRVARLVAPAFSAADPDGVQLSGTLPLVEARFAGETRNGAADRAVRTAAGARLLYQGHEELRDGAWSELRVDLADPDTGLAAEVHLRRPDGVAALQAQVTLVNAGTRRLVVESVSSFVLGGLAGRTESGGGDRLSDFDLWHAENDWLAESRWRREPLRELVVDINRRVHGQDPRTEFHRASQGTWSTAHHLPMAALTDRAAGRTVAWQVESSAGWRWELGEHEGAAYLALLGPTDRDHHWRQVLEPGDTFTTVPAAIAFGSETETDTETGTETGTGDHGLAAAIGELTAYRRALRHPHPDHTALPVIFNDYMNTLMGDPTTAKLLPLIDAAAESGAEVFVIDAGWYDDDANGWWDSVGEWREARSRFPGGFAEVADRIRAAGMTPGLWLEPEVVGVRSPLAAELPEDAFFQRGGVRVVENGRYHLDLRHPAAVAHLDGVVDRLIADFGIGYFKFDYNVNAGPGTDLGADSAGAGLLGHHRAHLAWLDALLERHPGLILENCGSGGARADYALLARMQLQSTSDQQDPYRYAPIAAAAPASIAPEQAASWAYPQPEHTDDEIAFTLCNALLGRVHLSGYLNHMSPEQRAVVAEAVSVYKRIRADIPAALPFWPLGLPGWTDPWVALGLRSAATTYLTLWRRDSEDSDRTLTIPHLRGHDVSVSTLFPSDGDATTRWDARSGELTVRLPRQYTACVIALSAPDGPGAPGQSSNGVL